MSKTPEQKIMRLFATCPEEIKSELRAELLELKCTDFAEVFKGIFFSVEEEDFYRLHLKCKLASHLYWVIKECAATTEKILFSQLSRIKWHKFFSANKRVELSINVVSRTDSPAHLTRKEVRKCLLDGIYDDFTYYNHGSLIIDNQDPQVGISAHIEKNRCTVLLCTSLKSLHKRGYRGEGHPAPLKETLAAAILRLAGYKGEQAFFDPFCGSGTLAIEAATIATNKASLIHRKKDEFGFEHLKMFDKKMWQNIQTEERQTLREPAFPVFAADLEDKYVQQAKDNALRARVEKYVQWQAQDFLDSEKPAEKGILITNLPYGQRLVPEEISLLYKSIGDRLKHHYQGWDVYLLVAKESPWKSIGLKTKRRIPLKNGSIDSVLLYYPMF